MFRFLVAVVFAWGSCTGELADTNYTVQIHTDLWEQSVTNNKVYLQLFGSKGNTTQILLQDLKKNAFKVPGATDVFKFAGIDVGILKGVRILKHGKDNFKWRGIEVHAGDWSEVLETPDYEPNGRIYDRSFIVDVYRGCPRSTYWESHSRSCEACLRGTCSLPGATSAEECSLGACHLTDMEEKLRELAKITEQYNEQNSQALHQLESKVLAAGEKMGSNLSVVRDALVKVQGNVENNEHATQALQATVEKNINALNSSISDAVSGFKSEIASQATTVEKISASVEELEARQSQQETDVTSTTERLEELAGKLATVASQSDKRLSAIGANLQSTEALAKKNYDTIEKTITSLQKVSTEVNTKLTALEESVSALADDIKKVAEAANSNKILINKVQAGYTQEFRDLKSNLTEEVKDVFKKVDGNSHRIALTGWFIYETDELKVSDTATLHFPDRLRKNDEIILSGYLGNEDKTFSLSLGSEVVPLRITFMYANHHEAAKITMDSKTDDGWRDEVEFPWPEAVKPGNDFTVKIQVKNTGFLVFLNTKAYAFAPQIPFNSVRRLELVGNNIWTRGTLIRFKTMSQYKAWNVTYE